MPTYVAPRKDADRLGCLKKALETGTRDREAGYEYVDEALLTSIGEFALEYETALNLVTSRQSGLSKEVRERFLAVSRVEVHTRDLWEVLRRRVARLEQPAEVLNFYQLPQAGTTPVTSSMDAWLTIAGQVIEGDKQAIAAGYPPMMNPSAAELEAVLNAARKEANEVSSADRALQDAQEKLGGLRTQADTLIEELAAQLRYTLRKKEASAQRRVMRSYGLVFAYSESESELEASETSQDTAAADTEGSLPAVEAEASTP